MTSTRGVYDKMQVIIILITLFHVIPEFCEVPGTRRNVAKYPESPTLMMKIANLRL